MNNEEYMKKIQLVNRELKSNFYNDIKKQMMKSYREILVISYGDDIRFKCDHAICIDDGYYQIKEDDVYLVNKEEAEFRQVICENCGEKLYLVNTEYFDWDHRLGRDKIKIKEIDCKKV